MNMANARNLRLGPNATYIPLTSVGGFALGEVKNCVTQRKRYHQNSCLFSIHFSSPLGVLVSVLAKFHE